MTVQKEGDQAIADMFGCLAEDRFEVRRSWSTLTGEAGERNAAGPPVSPSASTRRQEEAASEGLHASASSYRLRRALGWGGALIGSLLLWALIVATIRFIASLL